MNLFLLGKKKKKLLEILISPNKKKSAYGLYSRKTHRTRDSSSRYFFGGGGKAGERGWWPGQHFSPSFIDHFLSMLLLLFCAGNFRCHECWCIPNTQRWSVLCMRVVYIEKKKRIMVFSIWKKKRIKDFDLNCFWGKMSGFNLNFLGNKKN